MGSEMCIRDRKREAQKEYMEYWNSTAELTGTGQPVDAIIAPLAPWPAARPAQYHYYGYSSFVNLLDYTSVVVPVTNVDKNVDKRAEGFKAVDETDQKSQDACELIANSFILYTSVCGYADVRVFTDDPDIYDGAHVSVQLVGRRLQEEKMIALAKYVGDALRGSSD